MNVRACRVCDCTDDRACPGGCYWLEPGLCSACGITREQHVVSMTLLDEQGKNVRHLATCQCGWSESAIRTTGGRIVLDKRIKRHWQQVVARAHA